MYSHKMYAIGATYVSEYYKNQNFSHLPVLLTGQYNICCRYEPKRTNIDDFVSCRSLLKFQNIRRLLRNESIKKVILYVYVCKKDSMNWESSTYSPREISIYNNLGDFDTDTVTWRTKPITSSRPTSTAIISHKDIGRYIGIDITKLVHEWNEDSLPGHGITLMGDNVSNSIITYHSINNQYPPYIQMYYDCRSKEKCCCNRVPYYMENDLQEKIFTISGNEPLLYTKNIRAWEAKEISIFIQNNGEDDVEAYIQISPDGVNFIDDGQIMLLKSGEIKALTPYMFGKYVRVVIRNNNPTVNTQAKIWYQAQSHNYKIKNKEID